MKYINGKELLMFLEPPITRLSVFEAETVDAALIMCAEAFKKLETEFQVTIDFATFKYQLLKTMPVVKTNMNVYSSQEHTLPKNAMKL